MSILVFCMFSTVLSIPKWLPESKIPQNDTKTIFVLGGLEINMRMKWKSWKGQKKFIKKDTAKQK